MIFGHLSPPVADAGSHGRKWREIVTEITDVTNNKVNSNMLASCVLHFSLTIYYSTFVAAPPGRSTTLQRERLFVPYTEQLDKPRTLMQQS